MALPTLEPGDTRTLVKWLASGQPRAHADSEYTFIITMGRFGADGKWHPRDLSEELVKKIARTIGRDWVDKDNFDYNWASPTLKSCQKLEAGQWKFHIVSAYTG